MDNVQTKVPSNRRGKFLVVGLLLIILVMLFHLYRGHNFKKDMVRRKAFLIAKLRNSKTAEVKMSLKVEGQRKELVRRQAVLQQVQSELTAAKTSNQKQMVALQDLQNSATESKENLAALQKQYSNASSTIKGMEDKLANTVSSCEGIKDKNQELSKEIKEKENALENCLEEKHSLLKAKQDMENNYKSQMTLLQQTRGTGTGVRSANMIPPRGTVQNQQSLTSPIDIARSQNTIQSIPSNVAFTTNQNPGIALTQMPQNMQQSDTVTQYNAGNPRLQKNRTQPGHVSTSDSNPDSVTTGTNVI